MRKRKYFTMSGMGALSPLFEVVMPVSKLNGCAVICFRRAGSLRKRGLRESTARDRSSWSAFRVA